MSNLTYYSPVKIYLGQSFFKKLDRILEKDEKRVFFIVDSYFLKEGIEEKIKRLLPDKEIEIFADIAPNPSIEQVGKVRELLKSFQPEAVVAIGGGSALDTAKAASILFSQEGETIDFLTKKRELKAREITQ